MDVCLAKLKAVMYNISTLNQCRKFSCVTVVCKHFASYQGYPNYRWDLTLNLLMATIFAPPSNAMKWQMGFNSAFKGCMKNQQMHQLFIQFINYVWQLLHVSALHCHLQGAFVVPSENAQLRSSR